MVDATRFWVHGCEPGRVSDGSRLALCQTLSIECPSSIFFWHVYFVIPVPFSLSFCSHWSLVNVPLIFFCPADHVPDWQPRILLGMVEARSVNVKKTTTTTTDLSNADPACGHKEVPRATGHIVVTTRILRPTGIQIATKSYATLQAMAPANIKTIHQTSLLHVESSLDRLGLLLSPTHDQCSQQQS